MTTSSGSAERVPATGPRARLPIEPYPVILAAAIVLGFMAEVSVSPFAAFRLLVLVVVIAAALTAIATTLTHDRHVGALIAAIVVVVVTWSGSRSAAIVLESIPASLIFIGIIAVLVGRLVVLMRRAGRLDVGRGRVSATLSVFCAVLLVIVVAGAAVDGSLSDALDELRYPRRGLEALNEPADRPLDPLSPDIFVILLDGHPRADSFRRVLAGDPEPFDAGLAERGFDIASRSRSNYSMTGLTLASMFGMRPLEDIPQLQGLSEREARSGAATRSAINESDGFRLLRDHGYRIVSVASGFEQVRIDGADAVIDHGAPNEFEVIFLGRTLLGRIIDLVNPNALSGTARDRVLFALDQPARIAAGPRQTPIFAFVHVPSPHAPIVFARDGSPRNTAVESFYIDAPPAGPGEGTAFREALHDQVEWLDAATLRAIDALDAAEPAADRPAVVIVMSDHGTGIGYGGPVAETDVDERASNLFAARTPGRSAVFPDDVTPVNVLPLVMRAYLGLDISLHPNRTYLSPRETPFEYFEVPNPDAGGAGP